MGLSANVILACFTGLACEYLDRIGRWDLRRGCLVPARGGCGGATDGSWVVVVDVTIEEAPCRVTDGGGGVDWRCFGWAPRLRSSRRPEKRGVRLTGAGGGGAAGGGGWTGDPQKAIGPGNGDGGNTAPAFDAAVSFTCCTTSLGSSCQFTGCLL